MMNEEDNHSVDSLEVVFNPVVLEEYNEIKEDFNLRYDLAESLVTEKVARCYELAILLDIVIDHTDLSYTEKNIRSKVMQLATHKVNDWLYEKNDIIQYAAPLPKISRISTDVQKQRLMDHHVLIARITYHDRQWQAIEELMEILLQLSVARSLKRSRDPEV